MKYLHFILFLLGQSPMQDSPFVKAAETPVTKMLKKVEKANPRSSQPHHLFRGLTWQVTRCEYEVETNNGRATKQRKTKSTVMFEVAAISVRRKMNQKMQTD